MLFVLLFFVSFAIYWPGLYGDFFLDDYAHIVHNSTVHITNLTFDSIWSAANSTSSGPLGRPLALVSFALNHYSTGLDPFYFKLTNTLIHALTVIGVYFLLRKITGHLAPNRHSFAIPFIAALLWAVHPLNVSTVLYAVQRMTGMAALFTVWGMVLYCHGREQLIAAKTSGWGWIAGGVIAGAIGLYAKETAILILGYLLIIECMVFRYRMPTCSQHRFLQIMYVIAIGAPLVWALTTHVFASSWVHDAYANRAFTLQERLLTESRVLWDYLNLTWLPNIQEMGLYHDGYKLSHGLFVPLATIVTLAIHITLIVIACLCHRRFPYFTFAIAWFYIGHSAESTLLPLEIKYEHRNYLPMLGMVLAMVYSVFAITDHFKNPKKTSAAIMAALILTFGGAAVVRSAQFGDVVGFATMEAEHNPESSRANHQAAVSIFRWMMESKKTNDLMINQMMDYLDRSIQTNPNTTAPLFTAILFVPEITGKPAPSHFYNQLVNRLATSPPDANINSFFTVLLHQAEDGKIVLNSAEIHHLYESVRRNPHLSPGVKAEIITSEAVYSFAIEKNIRIAKKTIDQALVTDPSRTTIYVPAIWIYQEAGLWHDAQRLLSELKRQDTYGINRMSIEWLSHRQLQREREKV